MRRIKQLYDARSKYVHEGRSVPISDIREVEQVAMHVLWALLAVAGRRELSSTSEWLKKIQYVLAAVRDRRTIPEHDFQVLGVGPIGVQRIPPNRVVEDPYEEM